MSEEHENDGKDLGSRTYPPPEEFAKNANVQDPEVWKKAAEDYESFWEGWAKELHWFNEWDQVLDWNHPSPSGSSAAKPTRPTTVSITMWRMGGPTRPRSSG